MPFKPIGIPKQQWDLIFEEIEPVTREDGRVLKRYQVKSMPDMICTEEPMDCELTITEQKIEPYRMPETKYQLKDPGVSTHPMAVEFNELLNKFIVRWSLKILFDNTVKDLKLPEEEK